MRRIYILVYDYNLDIKVNGSQKYNDLKNRKVFSIVLSNYKIPEIDKNRHFRI